MDWSLVLFWLLLVLLLSLIPLGMHLITGVITYLRYRKPRIIICPETRQPVEVQVNAWRAVSSRLARPFRLRLSSCRHWPLRRHCAQRCLEQVVESPEECSAIRWTGCTPGREAALTRTDERVLTPWPAVR